MVTLSAFRYVSQSQSGALFISNVLMLSNTHLSKQCFVKLLGISSNWESPFDEAEEKSCTARRLVQLLIAINMINTIKKDFEEFLFMFDVLIYSFHHEQFCNGRKAYQKDFGNRKEI